MKLSDRWQRRHQQKSVTMQIAKQSILSTERWTQWIPSECKGLWSCKCCAWLKLYLGVCQRTPQQQHVEVDKHVQCCDLRQTSPETATQNHRRREPMLFLHEVLPFEQPRGCVIWLSDYLFFFFFRELFHYVDVCNIQIARYNLLGKKNKKSALLKSITFSLFMAQSRKTINIRTPVQILILRVADHIYSLGWEIKRASCLRILILSRQEIPCRKSNIWECSLHFHKQK